MNANNFHKYVKKVPVKASLDGTEIVYVGNDNPAQAKRTTTQEIADLNAAAEYLSAINFGAMI